MKKHMNYMTAAILGVTAVVSQGDVNYTWTGATDGNWSNTANWVGGTLPRTNDGLIYGDNSGANDSIITIQNGANMPASNIPMYANDWWRTPHFVVESGASFSVAQDTNGYRGPTGVGAIATVGSGATLTMTGSPTMVLMRDGNGRQSYNVTGGTLNLVADEFSFGYNNQRFSDWNLNAGNVVLTHKTWGLAAKVKVYGNGERYSSAIGTGFNDVNQSKVTLKNGSSFLINGQFDGRMDDSGDGSATVVFDLQNGSSLTFLLDTNGVFGTLADVEAGAGKYWISSTQGDTNLLYAIDGETATVSVIPEQVSVIPEPTTPLRIGSPFQNKMVLQRGKPIAVWGWANPGDVITVSVSTASEQGVADTTGKWTVILPALTAGGPYSFVVERGADSITYTDVLIGDVWIACGQSNMEFALGSMDNAQTYIDAITTNSLIRYMTIPHKVSLSPLDETNLSWVDAASGAPGEWSAVASVFAQKLSQASSVPIGIIEASWGSSYIEGWMPLEMAQSFPHFDDMMQNFYLNDQQRVQDMLNGTEPWDDIYIRTRPNILYNGMIHPLVKYGISGMLWYQGEANASTWEDAAQYGYTLPGFVQEYRNRFEQNFHFLAVQLPSYSNSVWPMFRESQNRVETLTDAWVAETIDTGDDSNIHPTDKEDIGIRLSLLARKYNYLEPIEAHGPTYESMSVAGNQVTINFSHASGLTTDDALSPALFEIAGSDKVFHVATSSQINGTSVVVSSSSVSTPVAVRYAMIANPKPSVNLYNDAGLPAGPFRTDNWVGSLGEQSPVGVSDRYETMANTTLNVAVTNGVLLNDMDLNYTPLSVALVSDVSNGTLELSTNGSFSYIPAPSFTGIDSFTYQCTDGVLTSKTTTVKLFVTNDSNHPPFAMIHALPATGELPLNVVFDSFGSGDSDGSIVSYAWDFGDGNTGNTAIVSHTYTTIGPHLATLTVTDNNGAIDVSSATISPYINSDVPVLWYTFDNQNDPYHDDSGNGYNGTAIGTPSWTDPAYYGAGVEFDGLSDAIDCGVTPGSADALTVAFWMKADKIAYMTPLDKNPNDSSGKGWVVKLRADGGIWFNVGSGSTTVTTVRYDTAMYSVGTWVHVACTFANGTAKIYVNGTNVKTQEDIPQSVNDTVTSLRLAIRSYENFDGILDDVQIYDFAMTEADVNTIMSGESLFSSPDTDTDGDGLTDAQEVALGTDPNDPDSGFGIDGTSLPMSGKIEISWPSATGVLYRVWKSPDLNGWGIVRDWTHALTPPKDTLEFDLSPSNGFFKVEAEIQ